MVPEDQIEEVEETTIYDEDGREELISDGEISPEEEAFMKGYEEADEEEPEDTEDSGEEE